MVGLAMLSLTPSNGLLAVPSSASLEASTKVPGTFFEVPGASQNASSVASSVVPGTFPTTPVPAVPGTFPSASPAVPGTSATVPGTSQGPLVGDVELRLDAPLPQAIDWQALCAVVPGEPLDDGAVRRTLSNFYATGRVEEVEVLMRPWPGNAGTVTAVLVVRLRPWVESVEIVGEPGLKPRQLLRIIRQKPSSPLSDELLAESRDALLELYWQKGFRRPEVELDIRSVAAKRAAVRFKINAGERASVGTVTFGGTLGAATEEQLRKVVHTRPGRPYDAERLQQDVERLRAWYLKQDYLAVRVKEPEEIYDGERGVLDLTFEIEAGEPVALRVIGASRRRLSKLGLLNFLRDPSFDEVLIQQSCQRLVSYYQRKGFFQAEISCRLDHSESGQQLTMEVVKGNRYEIRTLRFLGNEKVASTTLEQLMDTTVKRRLSLGSGRLVQDDLAADEANLRSYYLLQGFLDVEVGPAILRLDDPYIDIEIPISEGLRRRVVEVTWDGQDVFSDEEIARAISLQSGGPFHPARVDESVNILRTLYEDRGYPSASITPRLDWGRDDLLVDVHLDIEEGQQIILDRVLMRGLQRTRSAPVLRSMGLKRGEALSRRRLLEAERELYRLGIFSRVDVELAPTSELDSARDVIVRVEEGQRWRLGYGFSYHSDDGLGTLFSLVRNNIGGRGDRFQLDLRGNNVESRTRLIFDQPSFMNTNLPITFILFQEEEVRQAFTVDGIGAQILLTKDWRSHRVGLIYDYRRIETILTDDLVDLADLDREDREVEISSLTPNLFLDYRDDPLNPTQGWTTNLQLEYAFPLLNAEANFLKLFWQQTHYQPLGSGSGLAGSLRLGAIENLSDTAPLDPLVPMGLASARVPVSERFFAGGRTSHRAFERDRLGVAGETLFVDDDGNSIEVGGNGLLVFNLDYRFPISGDFGGTIFFDLGNVWADWQDVDLSDLEPGAGLGFRYVSPIGPIRLEIGWQLDPEQPGDDDPVFFLSFGNPF